MSKRKQQQKQATIRIVILAVSLVCINILASRFHKSIDLTQEKRFTLTDATKRMLRELKDEVVVDVYLQGKFPAGFQRLSEATREQLQSFKDYAGSKIIFKFGDPFEGKSEVEKKEIAKNLYEKGVEATALNVKGKQNSSQQVIYPYALVQYQGRSQAVRLLENHIGMSPIEELNYSESLLEYKLASAIHNLLRVTKPVVAYLMGNGEPLGLETYDLLSTLPKYYKVDTIDLTTKGHLSANYDAVIINKPMIAFEDKEKFKIDQYLMHGGKILWAVDMLYAPVDSLQNSGQFITTNTTLNLDDQLFKYGVRVNYDLVEDAQQCNYVPLITGTKSNGQPNIELRPWTFLPYFLPSSPHPIVHNMNAIMGNFVSSIDTIAVANTHKTILLETSNHSRVSGNPVRVSLSVIRFNPDLRYFPKQHIPVAVLSEGKFQSLYVNSDPKLSRTTPEFLQRWQDSTRQIAKSQADSATSMIVIGDGDIMLNNVSRERGPEEMGYWSYTNAAFANKSFILNCLEYLTDRNSPLEARSKDAKLRLLDQKRVEDEELKWQVINIAVPIGLLLVFASAWFFFRKRKYERSEK